MVVVLLSHRPKANSLAFLTGWVVGIVGTLIIALLVFEAVVHDDPADSPAWVNWLRVVLGTVLIVGGIWSYLRDVQWPAITWARDQLNEVTPHVAR